MLTNMGGRIGTPKIQKAYGQSIKKKSSYIILTYKDKSLQNSAKSDSDKVIQKMNNDWIYWMAVRSLTKSSELYFPYTVFLCKSSALATKVISIPHSGQKLDWNLSRLLHEGVNHDVLHHRHFYYLPAHLFSSHWSICNIKQQVRIFSQDSRGSSRAPDCLPRILSRSSGCIIWKKKSITTNKPTQ